MGILDNGANFAWAYVLFSISCRLGGINVNTILAGNIHI